MVERRRTGRASCDVNNIAKDPGGYSLMDRAVSATLRRAPGGSSPARLLRFCNIAAAKEIADEVCIQGGLGAVLQLEPATLVLGAARLRQEFCSPFRCARTVEVLEGIRRLSAEHSLLSRCCGGEKDRPRLLRREIVGAHSAGTGDATRGRCALGLELFQVRYGRHRKFYATISRKARRSQFASRDASAIALAATAAATAAGPSMASSANASNMLVFIF